jgi:hypothetical protein
MSSTLISNGFGNGERREMRRRMWMETKIKI